VHAPRRSAKQRRRARLAVTIAVLVILAAVGWIADLAYHSIFKKHVVASSCQVVGLSTGTTYAMDPSQLLNASTIADVAMQRALPQRAVLVALATALQESKLRNLDYGDRDSLGLFQQRPSQGWGSPAQVMTPTYAAGKFYDALVKVPNWQSLPVTKAADAVQRSGFPDAYKDWEPRATALSAALTGTTSGQLTCRLSTPGLRPDPSASNSTASATAILDGAAAAITHDIGSDLQITSPAVTPVDAKRTTIVLSGLAAVSSGNDDVAKHRTATVAAWALAHAATHGITSVVIGDKEWRADRGDWRTTKQPAADGSVVITISMR
jgi:hypothetical protein